MNEPLKLSAHDAGVWTKCSAYLHFKAGRNPLESREAAEAGIRLHAMLAAMLTDLNDPRVYSDAPVYPDDATADEIETLRFAYRYVESYGPLIVSVHVESALRYKGEAYQIVNYPDVVLFLKDGRCIVIDLKTGMREVEAAGNAQLIQYAHLLHPSNPGSPYFHHNYDAEYVGVILQPALETISEATIYIDPEYFSKLEKHVVADEFATGPHCRDCRVNDVCPEFRRRLTEYLAPQYHDHVFDRPAEWGELLQIAKGMEKMLEKVQANAKEYIRDGGHIPGWGISLRNGNRSWSHAMSPANLAKLLKLRKADVVEEKLKSPAKVEKILKNPVARQRFYEIVTQPSYPVLKEVRDEERF